MGVTCGGSLRDTCNRATDRCSRLFHCLSDPARRCALSLRAALVALHLVFAGVLFLLDNDLIEKTKQEPWYTATYVFLFVATLVQYFITSVTSPGFVLKAQKDVDEREASCRRSLLATNEANQLPASCNNGSIVITVDGSNYQRNATAWTKLVMDLYPPGTSTRNLTCPCCNVIQPPRAKHCHDCEMCVLQFDHHCFWLGTCIGQGNHCRFWWYIFEETALCLCTANLYIAYLKSYISEACYLVMTNQTTYELVRRRRIAYMRDMPERVFPFDKGVCRNLNEFCCARSGVHRMEPLPSAHELEQMSRPYTGCDVLSCRCC